MVMVFSPSNRMGYVLRSESSFQLLETFEDCKWRWNREMIRATIARSHTSAVILVKAYAAVAASVVVARTVAEYVLIVGRDFFSERTAVVGWGEVVACAVEGLEGAGNVAWVSDAACAADVEYAADVAYLAAAHADSTPCVRVAFVALAVSLTAARGTQVRQNRSDYSVLH